MKFKAWISAARLRTLPLSISGILVGSGIAWKEGNGDVLILVLALLTTLSFQVLSNFANDYGDAEKGTDNENRVGPMRAIQSGVISAQEMKKGIIVTILIATILTLSLIYIAFGKENLFLSLLFLILGGLAIFAAIKYTVGGSAYGYRGLGDLFVFIFFGLVSVLGGVYLYAQEIALIDLLPAISIGLLSVGVLNLNNMRDHVGDQLAHKNTLVVLMGFEKAKIYHSFLILGGVISFSVFAIIEANSLNWLINLFPFGIFAFHLNKVWRTREAKLLDSQLKVVALTTFLVSLIWFILHL